MELLASSVARVRPLALALLVTLTTVAAAAPPPAPAGSETPAPAMQLPEIGRTRATSAGCAALRDLVVPSFAAAQRADARFAETRKRLPQYVDVLDDKENRNGVYRQSVLAKLDSDASALLKEALVLNRALGDPRLSAASTDPAIVIERAQLQQLYDQQSSRANLLTELVMRERQATATHGLEDSGAFGGKHAPAPLKLDAPPPNPPLPATTGAPGMPLLSGNALGDKEAFDRWGMGIARAVRDAENQAAQVFIVIGQQCR